MENLLGKIELLAAKQGALPLRSEPSQSAPGPREREPAGDQRPSGPISNRSEVVTATGVQSAAEWMSALSLVSG